MSESSLIRDGDVVLCPTDPGLALAFLQDCREHRPHALMRYIIANAGQLSSAMTPYFWDLRDLRYA